MSEVTNGLAILAALALLGFILWTMPVGQRLAQRLGVRGFRKQGSSREDRAFLLKACGGSQRRADELLARVRANNPEMSDAEAYRRAIRICLRDKYGGRVA